MISNNEFSFCLSDNGAPYSLHFAKFTFGRTSLDWGNQMLWSSSLWSTSYSEMVLSSDIAKIYSYFINGSPQFLYFATFDTSSGLVSSKRFKSNVGWLYNYIQSN